MRRSTANIGLARLPADLRRTLEEAAANAADSASALERLAHDRRPELLAEVQRHALRGASITQDLHDRLRRASLLGDKDRGRLLELARAMDTLLEALEAAGHQALACDCGHDTRLLAGVLRDAVRDEAELVRAVTLGRPTAHQDHLSTLRAEGRQRMRVALAHALAGTEPLEAVRREHCLDLLEEAMSATRTVELALGRMAVDQV